MRSPLPAPLDDPNRSYASVTAHGSIMASVFPTLVAMGFGDAITVPTLARPLKGQAWAWVGFWLCVIGTAMAVVPVAMGRSSVLYTLSPPLIGSPWYDLGVVLVVLGSSWWIAVTRVNLRSWKREHPGQPVPLGLGGLGGLVQMSSAMHAMVHNTAWVTAHLHLIVGGAVVLVYCAIAYHLWPQLTGRERTPKRLARAQLWRWCWGIVRTTGPWQSTGLMGEPRRMATVAYADPFRATMGSLATLSVSGGLVMLSSVGRLLSVLVRSCVGATAPVPPLTYALEHGRGGDQGPASSGGGGLEEHRGRGAGGAPSRGRLHLHRLFAKSAQRPCQPRPAGLLPHGRAHADLRARPLRRRGHPGPASAPDHQRHG
jgi:heme/copper-type cytochrome/quinol oxidase subunit 1